MTNTEKNKAETLNGCAPYLLTQRVPPPSIPEILQLRSLETLFKRDPSADAKQLWITLANGLIQMIWSCSTQLTKQGFFSKNDLDMLIPDSCPKIKQLMAHFVHNKTDEEAGTNQPLQSPDAMMQNFANQLMDLLFNANPNEVQLLIDELKSLTDHLNTLKIHNGKTSHTPQPERIQSMLKIIGDIHEHLYYFDGNFCPTVENASHLSSTLSSPLLTTNGDSHTSTREELTMEQQNNERVVNALFSTSSKLAVSSLLVIAISLYRQGIIYRAEITNDGDVYAHQQIWSWQGDEAMIATALVSSVLLSELYHQYLIGNLIRCPNQQDIQLLGESFHTKAYAVLTNTRDLPVLGRILQYIYRIMSSALKDWQIVINGKTVNDEQQLHPYLCDQRIFQSKGMWYNGVCALASVTLASLALVDNSSATNGLFWASVFFLSPTVSVILSHVLEGLKSLVESASRSPSGVITQRFSSTLTLVAFLIAGLAAVFRDEFSPLFGLFMQMNIENYKEIMGSSTLAYIGFFCCAGFISVAMTAQLFSLLVSMIHPSTQGSLFFKTSLALLRNSPLYFGLFNWAVVAFGRFCQEDPSGECANAVGLAGTISQITITAAFFIKVNLLIAQAVLTDAPKGVGYCLYAYNRGHLSDVLAVALNLLSSPTKLCVDFLIQLSASAKDAVYPKTSTCHGASHHDGMRLFASITHRSNDDNDDNDDNDVDNTPQNVTSG
ncbi:MAG: hypothetical protein CL816_04030 [Coxiellaceae bacterium]|nr:hypothetical protein [Coxiellaceae bacterium]|tara:strand:+ start:791 stop:2953 length:2163 start_codon:yes stop_codon:yes gene_type:complete